MANDKFANVLTQKITMSAANTLTFQEVNIGLSLFDKAGILISRIDYQPALGTIALMTADTDQIEMGVTSSDNLDDLSIEQQAVVHRTNISRHDQGTAGSSTMLQTPFVHDFSGLPGGGIIITPRPWYVAMTSGGLASAGVAYLRFYFTVIKLQAQDYFELLETRSYFG